MAGNINVNSVRVGRSAYGFAVEQEDDCIVVDLIESEFEIISKQCWLIKLRLHYEGEQGLLRYKYISRNGDAEYYVRVSIILPFEIDSPSTVFALFARALNTHNVQRSNDAVKQLACVNAGDLMALYDYVGLPKI